MEQVLLRALRAPRRLRHTLELRAKQQRCISGEGAVLHPCCEIINLQASRERLSIGARTHVLGQLMVQAHGGSIHLGNDCFIGNGTRIWSADHIHIGNRVLLSHNVNVHDFNGHSLSAKARFEHVRAILTTGHPTVVGDVEHAPIIIEDEAWIGFNVTVLKGGGVASDAVPSWVPRR